MSEIKHLIRQYGAAMAVAQPHRDKQSAQDHIEQHEKPMMDEVDELLKDRARLEWFVNSGFSVNGLMNSDHKVTFQLMDCFGIVHGEEMSNWRDLIDSAMENEE